MNKDVFLIGFMGFTGAIARYFIIKLVKNSIFFGLPLGTMFSNFLGCALAGSLWGLSSRLTPECKELLPIISIGFLGSLTTFSAIISESHTYLTAKEYLLFGGNIIFNFTGGLLLFWISEKGISSLFH
jgi:CrcB protein